MKRSSENADARLILLLPGLQDSDMAQAPHLKRLLKQAAVVDSEAADAESLLFAYMFQRNGKPPAWFSYMVDFGEIPQTDCCYIHPVHLHADMADVLLFDDRQFDLPPDEAEALLAGLKRALQGSGMHVMSSGNRWYLCSDSSLARFRNVPPVKEIHGQPVGHILTADNCAPEWRRLMSELQIVMHQQAVNEMREQRGELPVNAVWIDGGEDWRSCIAGIRQLISVHPPVALLGRYFQIPHYVNLQEALRNDVDTVGDRLLHETSLQAGQPSRDMELRQSAIQRLEHSVFRLAWEALNRGAVRQLVLDAGCGRRYIIGSGLLRRLWQTIKNSKLLSL